MNIFEEVKQQLNIMQVIEHFGFKVNRAHKFICPFHNDTHPSASIKNDYFNCFVCGTGGDLITFTAKYLSISNLEACRELIRAFNLNIDISTAEEKKAQYKAYKRRKSEINKCDTLRDKFNKDKEIRADVKKYINYKLRLDKMQINKNYEKELQEDIKRVGYLLDDMHRFWWQGIELYPYGDERHTEGLQELTTCEYYLECYNENPEQFCKENRSSIKHYEDKLNRNEINKSDTLREKFNKDKEIRAEIKKHTAYKLRAERMQINKSKENRGGVKRYEDRLNRTDKQE